MIKLGLLQGQSCLMKFVHVHYVQQIKMAMRYVIRYVCKIHFRTITTVNIELCTVKATDDGLIGLTLPSGL